MPSAILLPYEEYEALTLQRQRMLDVLDVVRSTQIEVPGPFSQEHERAVTAYIGGEIDAAEAYQQVLAH
jgi:hypothetical protein